MLPKNKLLRWLLIITVALIVFVVIGKAAGWFGKGDAIKVAVEKVKKRNIIETVTASGKIEPETEVKISPDVSGEIVELPVKVGDRVTKGQLLAKIKPEIYESLLERANAAVNTARSQLLSAKARLNQAKSQLEKAEINYNRNKKLFEKKLISNAEFENIESGYEVAKGENEAAVQNVKSAEYNVTSSEAALKESRDQLLKTTILAPADAIISKLNSRKGERVVGTSQFAGTEIMSLSNLNEMQVNVNVNENDIVRVNMNDTAIIDVDAYPDRKFKGLVTEVANTANTIGASADQVTNFTVRMRILKESYSDLIGKDNSTKPVFFPGMSATVEIQTKRVTKVLSVPIQTVTTRDTTENKSFDKKKDKKKEKEVDKDDNGEVAQETKTDTTKNKNKTECVFVIENGKAKLKTVKIGIQDLNYMEIISGVSDSDKVVVAPYNALSRTLKEGSAVEVVKKEQLFEGEEKK
ncbi:MAG TPA: efflux RND transporter periplasmic adaptor subunit [Bacteroidia bacterium]|nr:efflux RND transporter periplasmic adaptor subunit [Bacteroidia bacterium]